MADAAKINDPYDAVIADIDAKIAQLQQTKAALEAVRAGKTITNQDTGATKPSELSTEVTPGTFHGMSIVEATKQLLAMRKKALGTPEITESIMAGGVVFSTSTPGNTVGSVLHRESAKPNGGVISVGRGTWALPAWHSNPGRFRKSKTLGEVFYPDADKKDEEA
jgi:hypothetical protein